MDGPYTQILIDSRPGSSAFSGVYGLEQIPASMIERVEVIMVTDDTLSTPDFFDLGIKAANDLPLYKSVTLQLNGGVQNIFQSYQKDFDRGANRDSNYIYGPATPRSFFAEVKISY